MFETRTLKQVTETFLKKNTSTSKRSVITRNWCNPNQSRAPYFAHLCQLGLAVSFYFPFDLRQLQTDGDTKGGRDWKWERIIQSIECNSIQLSINDTAPPLEDYLPVKCPWKFTMHVSINLVRFLCLEWPAEAQLVVIVIQSIGIYESSQ